MKSLYKYKKDLKKEKVRSANDAWKGCLKTWWLKPPFKRVNTLMHVGLWLATLKLNPLWKTEVSKSASIKSWSVVWTQDFCFTFRTLSNIGQKGYFFKKNKGTRNVTTPYSIPFLSGLHENKALHNFNKKGQRLIARHIKGLD